MSWTLLLAPACLHIACDLMRWCHKHAECLSVKGSIHKQVLGQDDLNQGT